MAAQVTDVGARTAQNEDLIELRVKYYDTDEDPNPVQDRFYLLNPTQARELINKLVQALTNL